MRQIAQPIHLARSVQSIVQRQLRKWTLTNGQQIVNDPSDSYQPSSPAFEQQWSSI